MNECWLISVPNDNHETWQKLQGETVGAGLSKNYKFSIPNELKVGTLDSLIGLSDELQKYDAFANSTCHKLASYMGEILEHDVNRIEQNLKVDDKYCQAYVRQFQWNKARYPTRQPMKSIALGISEMLSRVEMELRSKQQAYNNLKTNLQNMEKKANGSLLMRNLNQVVKADDVIMDSEYLQTLIVAVPVALEKEWKNSYENLTDFVAPKSSRLIMKDDEYLLFGVTLFKKVVDEFRHKCGKHKFFVRDFTYDATKMDSDQSSYERMSNERRKMLGPLLRWLKVNFSESFMALMHIKALRVFVESVLRYGLPVNFQAAIVEPQKKARSRLRQVLNRMYQNLDSGNLAESVEEEMAGLKVDLQEYYPYVYFKLDVNFAPKQ